MMRMKQEQLDFFNQSEKLLKILLEPAEPTAEQISLVAIKLRQTFESGMRYSDQNLEL